MGEGALAKKYTDLGGPEFYSITLNWFASMTGNSPLHGSALRDSYRPSTRAIVVPQDCSLTGSKPQLTGTKQSTNVFCFCC